MKRALFSIWAALAVVSMQARADFLFSQGPPNGNGHTITDARLADDFSLPAASSLNEIEFWYNAQFIDDLSDVTYAIYDNSAGSLGLMEASETISTLSLSSDSGFFLADFQITPLNLAPGTYWLELHAGTSLTDDNGGLNIDWIATDDNATAIALSNPVGLPDTPVNVSGFDQYSFQLIGTAVPEPKLALGVSVLVVLMLIYAGRRN